METGPSRSAYPHNDDDYKELKLLLEAFGDAFSLEDIASAYGQAKHDVNMTAEILYSKGSTSSTGSYASKDELEAVSAPPSKLCSEKEGASSKSLGLSSDNLIRNSNNEGRISRVSKPKKCSASMGTVSGVIGKDYVRPTPQRYESYEATKPVKLDSKDFPMSEIWSEEVPPAGNDAMHKNVEALLFQMLGEGFKLGTNAIPEVLGLCGYDIKKSMEKLLDLSASTLEKSNDVLGLTTEKSIGKLPVQKSLTCQENMQIVECNRGNGTGLMARNEIGSLKREASKDILETLFHAPNWIEEKPRRPSPVRVVRRSGKVVVEPLRDDDNIERRTTSTTSTQVDEDDDESSYEELRKAVREHWTTMKEYYTAVKSLIKAVEAITKGDRYRANKLIVKGKFHNRKAREADEKSVQMTVKTRDEDWFLDFRDHEPKEALHILRIHLKSIPGISSYQYLKVIVGTSDEDPKRNRKRRITKELEKESIKWTEEDNGATISIRLDEIDQKSLSYSKKKVEVIDSRFP